MHGPLADVEQFLAQTPPFDGLEPAARSRAARAFEAVYRRAGTELLRIGERNETLFLIRRGAVEAHDRNDGFVDRYGEGDSFGLPSLLSGKPVRFRITLIEDGLIWHMPKAAFDELRASSRTFDDFYIRSLEERLSGALRQAGEAGGAAALFMTALGELARREPISVASDTSIAEAARTMSRQGVSSLLVGDGGAVDGIVTDRDLRNRVLAEGRAPDAPVREVMTPDPLTLEADSPVLSGIVAMAGRGIHHLPLTRGGRVVGMVTTRDLLSLQTHHPLYLAARIQKQDSLQGVVETCRRVPKLFELLLSSGLRAEEVPKVTSTISDAVTRRLIQLAEAELGPAPAPWAWLAFGSQAREEQSLGTDQDNGIVYADATSSGADAYFAALAKSVSDGLDACGYRYCPGGIMATTPQWRQPLSGWLRHFAEWSGLPDPESVLRISIFFDLRGIHGERGLVARIHDAMADCARGGGKAVFLGALARQALHYDVPLGFFRRFVLESRGEHRETLDIKASGLLPLTDLVRVRALQGGVTVPATRERIAELVSAGTMGRADGDRLDGAHRLLSGLRVRLHADLVRHGETPHNHLDVRRISHAERAALRDAFLVVREAQRALAADFPG
jgi:CBS domain-containing protein